MKRWHLLTLLALLAAPAALAQTVPHQAYVYPAGGRQGATFQAVVGGQYLFGVTNAVISGRGVQARVVDRSKPISQKELNDLKEKLKELQAKRKAALAASAAAQERFARAAKAAKAARFGQGGKAGRRFRQQGRAFPGAAGAPFAGASAPAAGTGWTAEDEKTVAEILKKLAAGSKKQTNPAIAETVTLEVTVAADAPPGLRELRLDAPNGLSNPIVFCVGQLPEFREEKAEKDDPALTGQLAAAFQAFNAQRKGKKNGGAATPAKPEVQAVTLPAVVNGQIMPGEVDRYRFTARKGQRLVVAAAARELIPYLADAVPGWFQATLALYDAKGREVAYDDDFRFSPDPVLYYEIPADGEYSVEIKDSIYRGREDFVYRITIGELPFITSIFPLGGRVGSSTPVQLTGWNLPVARLTPQAQAPGLYHLYTSEADRIFSRALFAVDDLPEAQESEPNDQREQAQAVTTPLTINGRIGRPGDSDLFRFEGRAGERIIAEVMARRLNSPLDSELELTDAQGKRLAYSDDFTDKGSGLVTHHADSLLSATLPSDGAYYVRLRDTQRQGGPEFAYRLRLTPPRPDFELRVVPSGVNARAGATVPLTVVALRKDGFAGAIDLSLKGSPAGFTMAGGSIPPGQDQVRFTLTVPSQGAAEPQNLTLEGRAYVQGRMTTHPAVPAEDMMQAFFYHHFVPARELQVVVSGRGGKSGRAPVQLLGASPVRIPAGGVGRFVVGVPQATGRFNSFNNFNKNKNNKKSRYVPPMPKYELELSEPPAGLSIKSATPVPGGLEVAVECDGAKAKPGLRGNLIINAFTPPPAPTPTPAAAAPAATTTATTTPAPKKPAQSNQRRIPVGILPAIPFEVTAR